jgi:hypothetical protein
MYYEENVIDGVLCWRSTPTGEWVAKTPQQLTEMLLEARRAKAAIQIPVTTLQQPVIVYPLLQPIPPTWKPPYEVTC